MADNETEKKDQEEAIGDAEITRAAVPEPTHEAVEARSISGQTARRAKNRSFFAGIFTAVILVLAGVGGTLLYQDFFGSPADITGHGTVKNDGNKLVTANEMTISSVANKVSPSVVSIVTKIETQESFFASRTQEAAGSGVIVGSDGVILTNKHVISGAKTVQVILADGTTYDNVKILGTDPLNDLAFLKISGVKDLPAATIGDSSTVNIGQSVIAIGNSLGEYQNTVTSGIISGLGRPLTAQDSNGTSTEQLSDLIQTDAAINPGNSGGPLLNGSGQVIGINTAIAADAQGIGFAIPINSAKGILKEVLKGKSVERAFLGVRYIPIDKTVQKQYKLSVDHGAYIQGGNGQAAVASDSPAAKAGLRSGDIITKVNGIEVGKNSGVSSLVAEYAPGDTIQLTIVRDGGEKTIDVTLGAYQSTNF